MPSNSSLIFNPRKEEVALSQFSRFPLGRSEPNVVYTRSDESQVLGVEIPVVTLGNILPRVLVAPIPS